MKKVVCALVVAVVALLPATTAAAADNVQPLVYHGGAYLSSFTIYPLYYGDWNQTDINNQQAYLSALGSYMSGSGAPAGQQPVMNQYGVRSVGVAGAARSGTTDRTPRPLSDSCISSPPPCTGDIHNIIQAAQSTGLLPAYAANRLIMVFPAHGFSAPISGGCGYHQHESATAIYAVVPEDCGPFAGTPANSLVIPHEVFEAAADPLGDGWDEAVDGCTANFTYGGYVFPGPTDNTRGGSTCSATGYTSKDEIQVYGWTYTDFRSKYDSLWPQGWRLYSLQSYVTPSNQVLYNAVWRPSGNIGEIQVYGWTYTDFRNEYNTLWPQGWRLYIVQSYVVNGQTLYNAVWRQNMDGGEIQTFGVSYESYRSQYDSLWPQGWRLYILQSYVVNGQVLYNAVWHRGNLPEIQVYGWTYTDFRNKYDSLWPQGWRLYSLQAYVLNGQVLYNAVWRPGDHGEIQLYNSSYSTYRSNYDSLWQQGWRLYVLDTFYVNGQPCYNAVWRENTIDRPL